MANILNFSKLFCLCLNPARNVNCVSGLAIVKTCGGNLWENKASALPLVVHFPLTCHHLLLSLQENAYSKSIMKTLKKLLYTGSSNIFINDFEHVYSCQDQKKIV